MHPTLFEIGGFAFGTFGLMLFISALASLALALRLARLSGMSHVTVLTLFTLVLMGGFVGGKLLYVLTNLESVIDDPARILGRGGLVYYGAFLGGVGFAFLYIRRDPDLNFLPSADIAAPAIALSQTIGRLGCFSAGCDYGSPTSLPWAVTFTRPDAVADLPRNVALHPTQLYEAVGTLIICVLLYRLFIRRRFDGQVFCAYLLSYGILRFCVEFVRGDASRGFVLDGLFSTSQAISLVLISVAMVSYRVLSQRVKTAAH